MSYNRIGEFVYFFPTLRVFFEVSCSLCYSEALSA